MDGRGYGGKPADEVVRQQGSPEFQVDHVGGLAADVVQAKGLLDVPDIQFGVPSKAVQGRDVLRGEGLRVYQPVLFTHLNVFTYAQPRSAA